MGVDYTALYLFDCAARPGPRCRGDAFPRRVSVIPSAHLRRFVIATTDRDASADFFHRRPASCVLGLINRLCAIHSAPVTYIVEYYAHLLRATGLLLCHLLGPQHRRTCVPSPLHLHRRPLCIDDCAAQSLVRHLSAHGLRHADRVFLADIERYRRRCTLRQDSSPSRKSVRPDCSPSGWSVRSRTASSTSSTTTPGWGPLPSTSGIGTTGVCFRPRRVAGSGKPGTRLGPGGLTASTSASTLPFPSRLPRLHRRFSSTSSTALTASTSASPPFLNDCLDASPSSPWRLFCARGFMCDHLDIGNPTTTTSTTVISSTASSTTTTPPSHSATSTSAQRAIALLELLVGSCSSHSIRDASTVMTAGGCQLFRLLFSSLTVCDAPVVTAGGC